ncbi:hypothetical protein C0J52_08783 [Blattella germanica]|nr:hypothetical protein C0J52_08783 [Blattella germanica]
MLTKEQIQFYKENGYIKLSNIFTEKELQEISDEYDDLFERKQKENAELQAVWKGEEMKKACDIQNDVVLSIHNLQFHSIVFTRLILNNNLMDAMEDIMGTPNILLHHTKAHLKPPHKGAPFLVHQDYHYFPFKNHSMVAAFVNLDDSNPENGGLAVYPGSHKLGPLEDFSGEETGGKYHYVDPKKYPIENATPINAKRGDVIVFSYLLLHGSYVNKSERTRRMFLLQLMAAEDEPVNPKHLSPAQGLVLRGRNVHRDANLSTRHIKL